MFIAEVVVGKSDLCDSEHNAYEAVPPFNSVKGNIYY